MNTFTRPTFAFVTSIFLLSCGQQDSKEAPVVAVDTVVKAPLPDSILGERIKGRAEVRDKPGGDVLFTLADSTLVSCAEDKDGWCAVGLTMAIPASEYGTDTLRKGRKIVVEGKEVGEVLKDMYVTTSSTGKESWAQLAGYTQHANIYPFSVIEQALRGYVDTVSGRTLAAFQPFINSFKMERDEELKPYVAYFTYENWIDDPSPLPRVQLVFLHDTLVGVVHTRPLALRHTTDHQLERGFRVLFFNDVRQVAKDNFIKQFNSFITSVD
ncbi:MAG TPA: hypothetical protein VGE66_20520 [Chitinophagaceae bacterium]